MEEIAEQLKDLKLSLEELKEENESLKTEMKSLKELKEENASLKTEVRCMRFEILGTLQNMQQNQGQQSQEKPQQQPPPQEQYATFSPTVPYKWGDPTMLTYEERKDLQFEMYGRKMTRFSYEEGEEDPATFLELIRKGEARYDDEDDDDGLTNTYYGTFTTPMFGTYRFDVKGKMETNEESIAKWYLCCIRVEDDIFDPANPLNYDSDMDEMDDEKREVKNQRTKVFKERRQRQLLFTIDEQKAERDASIAIVCDKGVRIWIDVDIQKGGFFTRYCSCVFTGRLIM